MAFSAGNESPRLYWAFGVWLCCSFSWNSTITAELTGPVTCNSSAYFAWLRKSEAWLSLQSLTSLFVLLILNHQWRTYYNYMQFKYLLHWKRTPEASLSPRGFGYAFVEQQLYALMAASWLAYATCCQSNRYHKDLSYLNEYLNFPTFSLLKDTDEISNFVSKDHLITVSIKTEVEGGKGWRGEG